MQVSTCNSYAHNSICKKKGNGLVGKGGSCVCKCVCVCVCVGCMVLVLHNAGVCFASAVPCSSYMAMQVYTRNRPMADDVNLSQVAQDLPGLSGETLLESAAELIVLTVARSGFSPQRQLVLQSAPHRVSAHDDAGLCSSLCVYKISINAVRAVQ